MLSSTVVRVEVEGPNGFEDRPTFLVKNRSWAGVKITKTTTHDKNTVLVSGGDNLPFTSPLSTKLALALALAFLAKRCIILLWFFDLSMLAPPRPPYPTWHRLSAAFLRQPPPSSCVCVRGVLDQPLGLSVPIAHWQMRPSRT
jgi:hypothetical protein